MNLGFRVYTLLGFRFGALTTEQKYGSGSSLIIYVDELYS